jgi:hypothetical protein
MFLPIKGKSYSLSSQAAQFFSFAKGKKSLLQRNPAHMTRANIIFAVIKLMCFPIFFGKWFYFAFLPFIKNM